MLVVCVGLSRSASTLQYNIVRELVCNRLNGKDFGYSKSKIYLYKTFSSSENSYAVIKTHNYYDFYKDKSLIKNNVKFLCTFRDLREVAVSAMQAYDANFEKIKDKDLKKEMEKFYNFKQLSPLLMQSYSDLVTDLKKSIFEIGGFLGINLSESDVLKIYEKYNLDSQRKNIEEYNKTLKCKCVGFINSFVSKLNPTSIKPYGLVINKNKKTGLHFNHIATKKTDWRTQLSEEQKNALKVIISDWLIDVGIEKDDKW